MLHKTLRSPYAIQSAVRPRATAALTTLTTVFLPAFLLLSTVGCNSGGGDDDGFTNPPASPSCMGGECDTPGVSPTPSGDDDSSASTPSGDDDSSVTTPFQTPAGDDDSPDATPFVTPGGDDDSSGVQTPFGDDDSPASTPLETPSGDDDSSSSPFFETPSGDDDTSADNMSPSPPLETATPDVISTATPIFMTPPEHTRTPLPDSPTPIELSPTPSDTATPVELSPTPSDTATPVELSPTPLASPTPIELSPTPQWSPTPLSDSPTPEPETPTPAPDLDGDGFTAGQGDCDDQDSSVYPNAEEICDENDNDCDGSIDEEVGSSWYPDSDGDGFGLEAGSVQACTAPDGFAAQAGDCDDGDLATYPGASEACDGRDNNCDGEVDEGVMSSWYPDGDQDGFGTADGMLDACDAPDGYVAEAGDCNDEDSSIYPKAAESCNQIDDNCDGTADEGVPTSTWYRDADTDGYGDPATTQEACAMPAGYVDNAEDCDDTNAQLNPETIWYLDYDSDGYGADFTFTQCAQPEGYVLESGDCDNTDPAFYPGAPEEDCTDPNDYDCDGSVAYVDADGDGFAACAECDDQSSSVYPGAAETCNELDDNCDGQIDEGVLLTFHVDADEDGYGAGDPIQACEAPDGTVDSDDDCNDGDADIHPGGTESCDLIDNDCNGVVDDGYDLGDGPDCPAESCVTLRDSGSSSDAYWLEIQGQTFHVFCDMETEGGGWTLFHPDDLGQLTIDFSAYRTDPDHAMAYLLEADGSQFYTLLEELPAFADNYNPTFSELSRSEYGYPDPVLMRVTFVPRPDANAEGQTQGMRSNGNDLTFTNCDGNGNSYIEWWRTDSSYDFDADYNMSILWRDSKVSSVQLLPEEYFTFTAIHFGGCGTHSTSPYWYDHDQIVSSIGAMR